MITTTVEPTLHKPVPMGARVRIPEHYLGHVALGTVEGIAMKHVVFVYIVRLDGAVQTEYGPIRCITVGGAELEAETSNADGSPRHWRLDP